MDRVSAIKIYYYYKDKLIQLMTTSFIDIKFYIVHCLFMVVLVEAKIN